MYENINPSLAFLARALVPRLLFYPCFLLAWLVKDWQLPFFLLWIQWILFLAIIPSFCACWFLTDVNLTGRTSGKELVDFSFLARFLVWLSTPRRTEAGLMILAFVVLPLVLVALGILHLIFSLGNPFCGIGCILFFLDLPLLFLAILYRGAANTFREHVWPVIQGVHAARWDVETYYQENLDGLSEELPLARFRAELRARIPANANPNEAATAAKEFITEMREIVAAERANRKKLETTRRWINPDDV